jgi:hypothetical protein
MRLGRAVAGVVVGVSEPQIGFERARAVIHDGLLGQVFDDKSVYISSARRNQNIHKNGYDGVAVYDPPMLGARR